MGVDKQLHQFSLEKSEKILTRKDFINLSKIGHRVYNKYFIAVFGKGLHSRTRVGITVTKKIGCAVKRNRIKRVVREYFRLHKNGIDGTWDINIIAKKEASTISIKQVFISLQSVFESIARRAQIESGH